MKNLKEDPNVSGAMIVLKLPGWSTLEEYRTVELTGHRSVALFINKEHAKEFITTLDDAATMLRDWLKE